MDQIIPLLDDGSLIHPVYTDVNLMQGWLHAIELTVSGRRAQDKACHDQSPVPVQIDKGIYLGTLTHAKSEPVLSQLGITHLVDCSTSHLHDSFASGEAMSTDLNGTTLAKPSLFSSFENDKRSPRKYVHLSKYSKGENKVNLTKAAKYITSILISKKAGPINNVLIFCLSGVNRSAAVCAATLMLMQPSITLLSALKLIRDQVGPIIQVQQLQQQMLEYAVEISKLDDVNQWPSEENDTNIEREMFDDWNSISSEQLRQDDADYSDCNEAYMVETKSNTEDRRKTPDLLV